MKAAQFSYSSAANLDEALQALKVSEGAAKVMSGSQSLGPMLNLRLSRPAHVIDISRIESLRAVSTEGDRVRIGAAVSHADIEDGVHAALLEHPVRQVAAGIAYRAIRTRGTIGGSLAHADPAADWVVTLAAMGATTTLRSARGERTVPVDAMFIGAYTTVLEPDEVICSVLVPVRTPATRWGYHKLCRKPGEFAEASAAVYLDGSRGVCRIALGAVDGPPALLPDLAAAVAQAPRAAVDRERVRTAVRAALPGRDGIDVKLFTACAERALQQAGVGPTL